MWMNKIWTRTKSINFLLKQKNSLHLKNTNVLEKLLLILIRACEAENKIGESVTDFLQKIIYEPVEIIPF